MPNRIVQLDAGDQRPGRPQQAKGVISMYRRVVALLTALSFALFAACGGDGGGGQGGAAGGGPLDGGAATGGTWGSGGDGGGTD
ncbi:MAG TPA: hypothetical protein PKD61_36215, partial [Polyangiaceae bacterium]|nr:hypothetical protein [Polyangiaceae bacterium]